MMTQVYVRLMTLLVFHSRVVFTHFECFGEVVHPLAAGDATRLEFFLSFLFYQPSRIEMANVCGKFS